MPGSCRSAEQRFLFRPRRVCLVEGVLTVTSAGTRRVCSFGDPKLVMVRQVKSLDMLINNAGIAVPDDLTDPSALERHLAVNLFGTYAVTRAFLPALTCSRGAIINILSMNSLAPLPHIIPAYSVSKAAAFSLTQSLRALLAAHGVKVHAVLPGPVDTDMTRGRAIPGKASPESVALAIFDAIDNGEEDIFPDPASAPVTDSWRNSAAKALERQLAQLVPVSSVAGHFAR